MRRVLFFNLIMIACGASYAWGDRDLEGSRQSPRIADPGVPDSEGMTPLYRAVQSGNKAEVSSLIKAGARVNAKTRYGVFPLLLSIRNQDVPVAQMLLAAGADVNASLPSGETSLMAAARTGNPVVLRLLLRFGANVNFPGGDLGETALMSAAAGDHSEAILELARAGADVNARSRLQNLGTFSWVPNGMVSTPLPRGGWTPLMYAARQGAKQALRALARAGANLDVRDPDGSTALVLAIINSHYNAAETLLQCGADPNIGDQTGMTPLYAAVDMHTLAPMMGWPPPRSSDELTAGELVHLLIARGAKVDAQLARPILGRHHDPGDPSMGLGTSPFMRAAQANDIELMKALIEAGADPLLTQADSTTSLMIAAGTRPASAGNQFPTTPEKTVEALELCLEAGVDPDAFNSSGQTALHWGASSGNEAAVRFLMKITTSVKIKDRHGKCAEDLARPRIAALIRELANNQSVGPVGK